MTVLPAPAARLANAAGDLTMVALDQRESLRTMMAGDAPVASVPDARLREFKAEATAALSPYASAVLLDRLYGLDTTRPDTVAPGCRLILAADELHQAPGEIVRDTGLDEQVTPELVASVGATALKLLVIWRAGGSVEARADLVGRFVDLCRRTGTVSLVEGIVRPADGETWTDQRARHEAIIEAAAELSRLGADIYKAEVPGYVPGDLSRVEEQSRLLSKAIDIPWVVLSNGTRAAEFSDAVRLACLGGASGFLAGRAVWADTVREPSVATALRERSAARLRRLVEIVADARAQAADRQETSTETRKDATS